MVDGRRIVRSSREGQEVPARANRSIQGNLDAFQRALEGFAAPSDRDLDSEILDAVAALDQATRVGHPQAGT